LTVTEIVAPISARVGPSPEGHTSNTPPALLVVDKQGDITLLVATVVMDMRRMARRAERKRFLFIAHPFPRGG